MFESMCGALHHLQHEHMREWDYSQWLSAFADSLIGILGWKGLCDECTDFEVSGGPVNAPFNPLTHNLSPLQVYRYRETAFWKCAQYDQRSQRADASHGN